MSPQSPSPSPLRGSSPDGAYSETLRVPLRWWALATMFLASVLLAFLVATPPAVAFATAGALSALTVGIFLSYGGAQVEVADGVFRAGRAQIDVTLLADPEALGADQTRHALGVGADARAFLLVRPYLSRSVRVRLLDPTDPAPYWLVSTRHPRTLVRALSAAGATGSGQQQG